MKYGFLAGLVYTATLMGSCATSSDKTRPTHADKSWCFSGGPIYTALDHNPQLEAVAVKAGKITFASSIPSDDWCAVYAGNTATTVDLKGAALYPGFTDGHAHLMEIGIKEMSIKLTDIRSVKALQDRLAEAVAETSKGEPIFSRGWIETHWPEKRFPTRHDLDAVAPDNPVILERADGHAVVANSIVLERAGITRDTANPFGGDILKDDQGEPTGMLIDKAAWLVLDQHPKMTPERKRAAYIKASELYASRGWTNIHAMSADPEDLDLIESLAQSGDIKIRVYNAVLSPNGEVMPGPDTDNQDIITTRAIKIFTDGALGSRGAALLSPYSDDPDNSGLIRLDKSNAINIFTEALRTGTQVNTHAIGDRANRVLLDWYEQAFAAVPESERAVADPRWRIEHAQILAPEDIERFKALRVIPSMQPSHAIGDLHFAVDRLGKARLKGGYAWQTLIDSGAIIVGGSDAPVEVGDPRIEFYAAVTRKDLEGYNDDAWYPDEAVNRQNALKMFTAWPAYGAFEEDRLGTIEVGKLADFSVFDKDIMTASDENIHNAKVVMTMVQGELVYGFEP